MSWGLGKVKTVLLDSRPLSEKRWSYLLALNSVDIGKCVDLGYYNGRKVTYFPGCYCWPMENRQWKSHICIWVIHVCFLPGKMKCPVFKILKLRPYVFTWSAWQCMHGPRRADGRQLVRGNCLCLLCESWGWTHTLRHGGKSLYPMSRLASLQLLL